MIIRINKLFCWMLFSALMLVLLPFTVISEGNNSVVESINLPIIMYHHTTTDNSKAGAYTVLLSEFESDLEYIKKSGYTTVTLKDLYAFVNGEKTLPDKVVMITFDDGFESFYKLCFPVIKKHNVRAVMAVIGIESERYSEINDHNISYSNLNWKCIRELQNSGYVEIANHTYDLHHNERGERKGLLKLKNETDETYKKIISDDILKMQLLLKQRAGVSADCIAYPYGAYCSLTKDIIKELGLLSSFTCEERINRISKNPDDLFNLGRYNRMSGVSSDKFLGEIFKKSEG